MTRRPDRPDQAAENSPSTDPAVERRPRVVVVGSLNRDYVCVVDRLPAPGETVLGGELRLGSGGKGGNQAAAAALVGAAYDVGCSLVGAVGDDVDGEALLSDLVAVGVDVTDVSVLTGVRTGAALVTVASDGENAIVVAPGANHLVAPEHLGRLLASRLRPGDVVVFQGELRADATVAALRAAAAASARPVLNLAPYVDLPLDVLALCDPLVVNETEAGGVLGRPVGGLDDARVAARELAGRARSVVVTLGAAGALVVVGGQVVAVPVTSVEVVDTTGAGDAAVGALSVGLALGRDLVAAAGWAMAVASASVGRPGAQASYPRGEAVRTLLEGPETQKTQKTQQG